MNNNNIMNNIIIVIRTIITLRHIYKSKNINETQQFL